MTRVFISINTLSNRKLQNNCFPKFIVLVAGVPRAQESKLSNTLGSTNSDIIIIFGFKVKGAF